MGSMTSSLVLFIDLACVVTSCGVHGKEKRAGLLLVILVSGQDSRWYIWRKLLPTLPPCPSALLYDFLLQTTLLVKYSGQRLCISEGERESRGIQNIKE